MIKTLWLALMAFLLFTGTSSGHEHEFNRPGFSDPSYQVPMPEGWKNRPVQYESWAEGADIAISMGQHLYPAALPIINEFAKKHNLNIVMKKGVCGITAGRLAKKSIDIGSLCCPAGKDDRLPGIKFYTMGIVPVAVLINKHNPVSNISFSDAQKIFRGELRKWSLVNGSGSIINPLARLHCKMRPGMWRLILPDEDLFGTQVSEVGTINGVIVGVADDPDAISFENLWQVKKNHKRSDEVKILKIDGHDPSKPESLASGDYPVYQVITVAVWEGAEVENPKASELVYHLRDKLDSRQIMKDYYFVPVSMLREAGWEFNNDELVGGIIR